MEVPLGPIEAAAELARPHAPSLCDPCLGRLFARLGDGRSNLERGQSLRQSLGAAAPPACSLCEGLLDRVEAWTNLCLRASDGYEHDTFLVGTVHYDSIRHREASIYEGLAAADTAGLAAAVPARPNSPPWALGEWLKTEINREVGRRVEAATGKKVDLARPDLTYRVDTRFDHISLQLADLYLRGRYRKFARDLPQTRWPCRACGGLGCRQCGGKGTTYDTSVEEIIAAPVLIAAGGEGEAFHGMGREDIDARTLGTGRPFILEIKRPRRRSLDWTALEAKVNQGSPDRVEVEGLGPAGHQDAALYKAADPAKTYRARCVAAAPVAPDVLGSAVAGLEGAELEQRTPHRVSHRRADLVRKRRIQRVSALESSGDRFTLEVRADSGTYIKEFVSGDEGRTRPSLSERLGVACRVEELDVVGVHWEEPVAPAGPGAPSGRTNA